MRQMSQDNTVSPPSRVLLMSYPRSGNHLTQAMLQCLLQIETYGYTKEKNDGPAQKVAILEADAQTPYIRKIHYLNSTPADFASYSGDHDLGLIYLIRDPAESILSENKYVPHFWKHYEYVFEHTFLELATFYEQWKSDSSKLVIFYEDYFNPQDPYLNLRKIADYFGEKRVSKEQLSECEARHDEVVHQGLSSLDRQQSSTQDLHFYKHSYYGEEPAWPKMKVTSDLYALIF